jgi:hypothetical protein
MKSMRLERGRSTICKARVTFVIFVIEARSTRGRQREVGASAPIKMPVSLIGLERYDSALRVL